MFGLFNKTDKNLPMKLVSQAFIQGREGNMDAILPVMVVDSPYLKMRFNDSMPVTASAFISYVKTSKKLAVYSKKELDETDCFSTEFLAVGKKFLALPRKQQLALVQYEQSKLEAQGLIYNTELNLEADGIRSSFTADVDARHDAISQYGRSAVKALHKVEKLDRKGQIKTSKVLKSRMKDAGELLEKNASIEQVASVFEKNVFGISNSNYDADIVEECEVVS